MEISSLSRIQWQIGDLVRVHRYWWSLIRLQWARRRVCWAVIGSRWLQQSPRQLLRSRAGGSLQHSVSRPRPKRSRCRQAAMTMCGP